MSKTVAIFLAGQKGDILSASCVLRYREKLWPDCKLVWYVAHENRDLLKHQDIELRTFPRGFGYPELVKEHGGDWEDWQPLVDWDNHMNVALKHNYPSLEDIDIGYFPAPHQMSVEKRHGIEYPNISKKVFGVPMDWLWHPVIHFTEKEQGQTMWLEYGRNNVAIETFAGSGQSTMSDAQVRKSMELCRQVWPDCKFIFLSHKYLKSQEDFPEDLLNDRRNYFCGLHTITQCALIVEQCDLLISVSSGITVAASAWDLTAVPILQYTGSTICSTRAMALGRFELVTHDDKPLEVAQSEYYERLKILLHEIK